MSPGSRSTNCASDLTAFAEVLYTNRETVFQDELYVVQNALVPATNPFNPFHEPVLADFLLPGIGPRLFIHELDLVRGTAGLRGSLGSTWQWEVTASASAETNDNDGTIK